MLLIHRSTISNIEYKMILKKTKISVLTQRWPNKKNKYPLYYLF